MIMPHIVIFYFILIVVSIQAKDAPTYTNYEYQPLGGEGNFLEKKSSHSVSGTGSKHVVNEVYVYNSPNNDNKHDDGKDSNGKFSSNILNEQDGYKFDDSNFFQKFDDDFFKQEKKHSSAAQNSKTLESKNFDFKNDFYPQKHHPAQNIEPGESSTEEDTEEPGKEKTGKEENED
ncbi:unnamed protein product [Didymodactylos carnosus]|uniref:Uncharacterized protein n=2 Tax=Didymodactylos carnosus TaxID=1234261 RepID=A0A814H339_9BILA|nr:unnamed protein product [Didymodactylos carnosus]CAF1005127.1 unnamed protein product [Didymodactylos carnosus]CAF3776447.1 unnamed protein product [Didymodactylos carnosus]CAF3776464.1 unnamed protein product [Didymodactylos carnosus]